VRLKALPVKDNIDNLANTKATTMRTCSSTGEFIGELNYYCYFSWLFKRKISECL
jgi:hypothetical protein